MNMILVVLCILVGVGTMLPSFSVMSLAVMAENSDAMAQPVIAIAASLCLIVGVIMARKKNNKAVKVLWASVALYVVALLADDLGFYRVAGIGGIIWSAIASVCTMRASKKPAEVKEG